MMNSKHLSPDMLLLRYLFPRPIILDLGPILAYGGTGVLLPHTPCLKDTAWRLGSREITFAL